MEMMIDTPFRQTRVPRLHTVRFSLALGSGQRGDRPEHTLALWQSVSGSQVWPASLNPQSWLQHRPWLGLTQKKNRHRRKTNIWIRGAKQACWGTCTLSQVWGGTELQQAVLHWSNRGLHRDPHHTPHLPPQYGFHRWGVHLLATWGETIKHTLFSIKSVSHGIKNSHLQNIHPFSVVRARWFDRRCTERAYRCFHAPRLRRVGTSGTGLCHHLIQGSRSLIPRHAETKIGNNHNQTEVLRTFQCFSKQQEGQIV